MATDYTEHKLTNTIAIINACLKAGHPERIVPALLDYRSAEGVEAELALAATTTRAPERTAAARASAVTPDALAAVIEKRFRTQNRRPGS